MLRDLFVHWGALTIGIAIGIAVVALLRMGAD